MDSKNVYFIGLDVGTQSVRAGLVGSNGSVVKVSASPIKTYNPFPNMYEQSSDSIWELCVKLIKDVTKDVDPCLIRGIGFDATCSLVAVDKNLNSLSLSKTGNQEQNIILWMDHRAIEEANFINSKKNKVLKFVGGKISPEMEAPKLLWIKKVKTPRFLDTTVHKGVNIAICASANLPVQWENAGYFFDLPDFLTWKATNSLQRSLCSLVCKWTYLADDAKTERWQDDFWNEIGLSDLVMSNYKKIGTEVLSPGQLCGQGLSKAAAKELGLNPGTPVSVSIIDAHAGGLGVLACTSTEKNIDIIEHRLALICGTSTCHMKINKQQLFTNGVWGPYYSAMVPGFYCSEAGQSAAGALLDHIINSHPASIIVKEHMTNSKDKRHITDELNESALKLMKKKHLKSVSYLASDYHVYPDYHGNRSPIANPNLKGMVCGLTLSNDENDLIQQYIATLQALAYSTKHIISALEDSGHVIKTLLVCGGLAKNNLYIQLHADITGLPVIIPYNSEPVIVGSAILAASAAKFYPSVLSAMTHMCGDGALVEPNVEDKLFHDKKYKVYLSMLQCQESIAKIMIQ